jgi:hypothetical protein
MGLSSEFVTPTLNGGVAILAEKVAFEKPEAVNLSESQVLTWVDSWWNRSDKQGKINTAGDFSDGCDNFLTSLVASFQQQANEVAILGFKVNSLTNAAHPVTNPMVSLPPAATSAFAALQQLLGVGHSTLNPQDFVT